MSFIVKGIDLPQILYTDIRIYKDGRIKKIIGESTMISCNENVQAIQIPKGHGRLIDADLLKDTVRDSVPAYGIGVKIPTYGDMDIMGKIGLMPTILEEEREDG